MHFFLSVTIAFIERGDYKERIQEMKETQRYKSTPSHHNYIIEPSQEETLSTPCLAKASAVMFADLLLCWKLTLMVVEDPNGKKLIDSIKNKDNMVKKE